MLYKECFISSFSEKDSHKQIGFRLFVKYLTSVTSHSLKLVRPIVWYYGYTQR